MLRSLLIYLSRAAWAQKAVTQWQIGWQAASRFIAGKYLEDAVQYVKLLNSKGINATLDHLGEHTNHEEDAQAATEEIVRILDEIDKSSIRSNVSVKLSQLGLALDEQLCIHNMRTILKSTIRHDSFVRIDMEDSTWLEKTLSVFRLMQNEFSNQHVGVAIQAYLYRSERDLSNLLTEHSHIRLCKGAYKESPLIAYRNKSDVDVNYDKLSSLLIDVSLATNSQLNLSGKIPPIPAIASHDEKRIKFAKEYSLQVGLPKTGIEFQMLNGIRRDLQEKLALEGYPVRVYVPYGTEWYPYLVRRLAERPANLWFFLSNLVRR